MIDLERPKAWIGIITATFALIGGGYTAVEKTGVLKKPIITWDPNNFSVSDAPARGEFKVVVAREKHRDDCKVTNFKIEVRDSAFVVHSAKPSIMIFSGPANNRVDKFGFKFTIEDPKEVASGKAMLLGQLEYKCPEGDKIIAYPDHNNLTFNIR